MQGDFSKFTFQNHKKRYRRVLMQQGRVQLDADWNEQVELSTRQLESAVEDIIGANGAPADSPGYALHLRGGLTFDGVGDYVLLEDPGKRFAFPGKKPFTIEAWLVIPQGSPGGTIISCGHTGDQKTHRHNTMEYSLSILDDGRLSFRYTEINETELHPDILETLTMTLVMDEDEHHETLQETISSLESYQVNVLELSRSHHELKSLDAIQYDMLTHVAVVVDRHTVKLYIDGRLMAIRDRKSFWGFSNAPTVIGAELVSAVLLAGQSIPDITLAHCFAGTLYEMRVWRSPRSEYQLRSETDSRHWPKHSHLEGLWRFEEGHGAKTFDLSHNKHTGLLANAQTSSLPQWEAMTLWIDKGHYYVGGVLCENPVPMLFEEQPDNPGMFSPDLTPTQHKPATDYCIYLDSWERFVSAFEDASLRDVALGGADTAARAQMIGQVKVCPEADYQRLLETRSRQPHVRARLSAPMLKDNRLYRLEIHNAGHVYGGNDYTAVGSVEVAQANWQGHAVQISLEQWPEQAKHWMPGSFLELYSKKASKTIKQAQISSQPPLPVSGTLLQIISVNAADKQIQAQALLNRLADVDDTYFIRDIASYKWSNENGSIVYPIEQANGNTLRLNSQYPEASGLTEGSWIELLDDTTILTAQAFPLNRIETIDTDMYGSLLVNLQSDPLGDVGQKQSRHPLVRRWEFSTLAQPLAFDVFSNNGVMPAIANAWWQLENGIEIFFDGAGICHTGDYWLMAARALTQSIDWPKTKSGPVAKAPQGIKHSYALLAKLVFEKEERKGLYKPFIHDLRNVFAPLGEQLNKHGDTMTGPLNIQSHLRVAQSVRVDGDIIAKGHLYGELGAETVGTQQLKQKSVTASKLAPDIGLVPVQFSILGESPIAPAGYQYTHSFIQSDVQQIHWNTHRIPSELTGRLACAILNKVIYVYSEESGELWAYYTPEVKPDKNEKLSYEEPYRAWVRKQPAPHPHRGSALKAFNNHLHLVGGFHHAGKPSASHWRYCPQEDEWLACASLPIARGSLGLAECQGRLYALGGLRQSWFSDTAASHRCTFYDPDLDAWFDDTPMPEATYAFGIAGSRHDMYVLGGKHKGILPLPSKHATSHCYRFTKHDLETPGEWHRLESLPHAWPDGMASLSSDSLLVSSRKPGKHGEQIIYSYNTSMIGKWRKLPLVSMPHKHFSAMAALQGVLYVFGEELLASCNFGQTFYIHRKTS